MSGCGGLGSTVQIPALKAAMAEKHLRDDRGTVGYLYRPQGSGPHPAVILMHGCAGLEFETRDRATWNVLNDAAQWYLRRGYVAMIVDSYGPRGHGNLCSGSDTIVPYQIRAWDAAAAADLLVRAGHADPRRIVVHGLSAGGASAIQAVGPGGPAPGTFAAAVAFYPPCEPWAIYRVSAPVLVLTGSADLWTPAFRCVAVRDRVNSNADAGPEFVVRIFDGATHSFDFPYSQRVYRNYVLQYDPAATAESWKLIEAFLARHVR